MGLLSSADPEVAHVNDPSSPCPVAGGVTAEEYLAVVVRTVQRVGARRYGVEVADELVQAVAEQFWPRRVQFMATYSPEVFAAVAMRSRADELRRRDRIQRGQGARLVEGADGHKRPGRDVVAWEAHVAGGGPVPHAEVDVAQRVTDAVTVNEALDRLDERSERLVLLVDGWGLTVGEAAATVGLSRAYANRELTRIRSILRDAVSAA
jgi:RNA polymerase sigma factor (sigma-70 family)